MLACEQKLIQNSYYTANANAHPSYPSLNGDAEADVCIVGAGLAGLSAAIELADRGYKVIVLEAENVGWGASGRNGGQIIAGLACDQSVIEKALGFEAAKQAWGITIEALDLVRERVKAALFSFEDIVALPDRAVQQVLRGVDTKDLALALKGAGDAIRDKLLGNLSSRAGETLREEIELLGRVRMSAVEEARNSVLRVVRELEQQGQIVLERSSDDFVD